MDALREALSSYTALSLSRAEDYRSIQLAVLALFAAPPSMQVREVHALVQRIKQKESLRAKKEVEVWSALECVFNKVDNGGSGGTEMALWASAVAAVDAAVLGRVKRILEGCGAGLTGGAAASSSAGGAAWRRDKKSQRLLALLYRFMPNLSLVDPRAIQYNTAAALRSHSGGLRQHLASVIQISSTAQAPPPEALQALRQDIALDFEFAGRLMDYSAALNTRLTRESQAALLATQPLSPPTPHSKPGAGGGAASVSRRVGGSQRVHGGDARGPRGGGGADSKSPISTLLSQLQLFQPLPHEEAQNFLAPSQIPEEILGFSSLQREQQQQQQLRQPGPLRRQVPGPLVGSAQRQVSSFSSIPVRREWGTSLAEGGMLSSSHLDEIGKAYSPRTSRELRKVVLVSPRYPPPILPLASLSKQEEHAAPLRFKGGGTFSNPGSSAYDGSGGLLSFNVASDIQAVPFTHTDFTSLAGGSTPTAFASSASSYFDSVRFPTTREQRDVPFSKSLADLIAQALAPPSTPGGDTSTTDSSRASSPVSTKSSSSNFSFKAAAGNWLLSRGITVPTPQHPIAASSATGATLPLVDNQGATAAVAATGISPVAATWERQPFTFESTPPKNPSPYAIKVAEAVVLARTALAKLCLTSSSPLPSFSFAGPSPDSPRWGLPSFAGPDSPRGGHGTTPSPSRLMMSGIAADAVANLAAGNTIAETNRNVFRFDCGDANKRKSPIQEILMESLKHSF